jgi:hypothetical protein
MSFIGRKAADKYGELIACKDMSAVLESVKTGRAVHVDHGVQILVIQEGIYEFLSECLNLILGKDFMENPTRRFVAQPEPPCLTTNDGSFMSLNFISRDAPYRLPSMLDIPRLQVLVSAQLSQAVDHAVMLREDPSYFVEISERYMSHRPELLLDADGRPNPNAGDYPMYNKAQRQMAADAHCAVFYWHEIHERMTKLRQLSRKYAHEVMPEKDLPSEYFETLVKTRSFIETISLDLISIITTEYRASPPLREYHYRKTTTEYTYYVESWPHVKKDKILHSVLILLVKLEDKGLRDLFNLHCILDELERIMQDEPRAKSLITPHLASSLSQLSVMSECLNHIHQFQPWAYSIENAVEEGRSVMGLSTIPSSESRVLSTVSTTNSAITSCSRSAIPKMASFITLPTSDGLARRPTP